MFMVTDLWMEVDLSTVTYFKPSTLKFYKKFKNSDKNLSSTDLSPVPKDPSTALYTSQKLSLYMLRGLKWRT